jgi:hypothetical protein
MQLRQSPDKVNPASRLMSGRLAAVLTNPSLQIRSVVRRMGLLALLFVATLSGATVGYVIIEDFTVEAKRQADGLWIRAMALRDPVGASILGLRHQNGDMRVLPSLYVVLVPGETVVALGTREQLDSLG